jgi:hypothetical protein
MVQLGQNFDASSVEPNKAFELLAPGWYAAMIVASEWKETSSGGQMLVLTLDLLENVHPEHKGRKIWARLNLRNASEQAVQIAQRDLSAICRAVGVLAVTDTEALHHKPLAIKLKVRPAKGEYEASNEIAGYDPIMARFPGGSAAAQPAQGAVAAKPAVSAAPPAKLPWQK